MPHQVYKWKTCEHCLGQQIPYLEEPESYFVEYHLNQSCATSFAGFVRCNSEQEAIKLAKKLDPGKYGDGWTKVIKIS